MLGRTVDGSPLPARRGPLRPLSVAPMVDRTDRCFRVVMRAVTRRTLLYTEMISVAAALGRDRERVLGFDDVERPLAVQLGGDDPARLAEACRVATALGYDEIDLNCGCPSARVQEGRFGAVLMKDPARVAACVAAMRAATPLPVTVKHRLGVDAVDRYEDVACFVRGVAAAGADRFIVHARKAWLSGLSPADNRCVPPLRWEWVHRLKAEHPTLRIEVNGGITTLSQAFEHLGAGLDGVMIGRAAYDDPMSLAGADAWLAGDPHAHAPAAARTDAAARLAVLSSLVPAIEQGLARGLRLHAFTRHLLGLVHGLPGARRFRRELGEGSRRAGAGPEVLVAAIGSLAAAADDRRAAAP
jgi:tRNA-dihydrouridine synthase A